MLSTAGNSYDEAYDINDAGVIVGKARAANGYDHAAAWTDGRIVDIGAASTGAEVFSTASAINRWGMIGGSAWTVQTGGGNGPLFWMLGPGESVARYGRIGNTGMNDVGQSLGMVDLDPSQHVLVPVFIDAEGRTTQMLPGTTYGFFTRSTTPARRSAAPTARR
jgi:probable HAF family extracellular repeat protein